MTIETSTDALWLERMRERLIEERETQQARLAALGTDHTGDPGESHNQAALVFAARHQLEQIDAALSRLSQGRYGACEGCAALIPRERLEVLPHARYCVPCLEKQL